MRYNLFSFFFILREVLTETGFVADRWKAVPTQQDAEMHNFLKNQIPSALAHTGAHAFDSHLLGVQQILRRWGAPRYLANAGLMHSIYGTDGFQGFKLPWKFRPDVQSVLGSPESERLVFIFCAVDRVSVDETVISAPLSDEDPDKIYSFRSRPEFGSFTITLRGEQEWLDFLELSVADW
jgi:hypothetical protein